VAYFQKTEALPMHTQWAVNEKVAFEIAYAASIAGVRSAVSMKQVGLNVASDPLMSAAYMGVKGGFIVVSADDPGPLSSQTEQDSRMMAMMAKIPVLDPDSPKQAKEMIETAYALSETFEIPVLLRPTTRVCHSRQDIAVTPLRPVERKADFKKDPARWAATPKFRYQLHNELEKKLAAMARYEKTEPVRHNPGFDSRKAVVSSGVAAAHIRDILMDLGLRESLPFYQVLQPFPLHEPFSAHLLETYDEILVIEETTGVIEMQLADRNRVRGRLDRTVPRTGELLPEIIQGLISRFAGIEDREVRLPPSIPGRRPTLCPGCPHRASFFAIKKAAPKGIYTSDIGCYTLGLNIGAVDTVLCMGAAISQAAGFYQAYRNQEKRPAIVATIGDSTFFHSGVPPLMDAVVQKVPLLLVILDNRTTAMTGNQPTLASGLGATGEPLNSIDLKELVSGCGVTFCREEDPYRMGEFVPLLKDALQYTKKNHAPGEHLQAEVVDLDHPGFLYPGGSGRGVRWVQLLHPVLRVPGPGCRQEEKIRLRG
jgi:indolepyruvate ferredoxin oxidoreductase alpha subunit